MSMLYVACSAQKFHGDDLNQYFKKFCDGNLSIGVLALENQYTVLSPVCTSRQSVQVVAVNHLIKKEARPRSAIGRVPDS